MVSVSQVPGDAGVVDDRAGDLDDAPSASPTRARAALAGCRRGARRHVVFGVLLAVAVAARVLVLVAYPPALMYLGDSAAYLDQAWRDLWPGDWRPSGYPIFLRILDGPSHVTRIVVVQHLLTLAVAVALYAAALRAVRRPWLAALAAAPALLAPWVLDLGQFVLADSLFGVLVSAGVAVLAGWERPRAVAAAGAGLLLGAALCVRTVGYGPLTVAVVVLVVDAVAARGHRTPVRAVAPVVAFVVAAAVPVGAYAGWSAAEGKGFAVSAHSGFFLYGRVAPFADCSTISRADLRTLCDPRPAGQRGAPVRYLWPADSPLRQGHRQIPPGREDLAGTFARGVVREQPWALVTSSARYLAGYLYPVPYETPKTSRADTWELPTRGTNVLPPDDAHADDGYFVATAVHSPPAGLLAAWSRLSYAPMPLVGLGLLAGMAASLLTAGRAIRAIRTRRAARGTGQHVDRPDGATTGPPPAAESDLGRPAPAPHPAAPAGAGRLFWLAAGSGVSTLVLSAVTSGFDYRYLGAVIGPIALAAIIGAGEFVAALRRRTAE
ncbi:hypothetical protein [Frankia sp. QA3]|uniref:hypothetical protein n=1 Tax=Frankia sp. QA3 TaxID=710111 RepID=UPI000269C5FF|nr:hypothetical protein [Frankia sp. QA3]EIV93991.1 hypothetical protein FraQA3DRAFT_3719 [Frankia sp. QA3]